MPSHRQTALLVALIAGGALLIALASQYWGGLAPCVLCLWQRWAYVGAGLLALAAALAPPGWRRGLLALAGLSCLAGAGLAAYHVGVEQHWWTGTNACAGVQAGAGSLDALRAQILSTAAAPRCDEVAWSLFGISMAGYNFLLALALGGLSLAVARRAPHEAVVR
jgi:disulfide bond formation protein DsbB